MTSEIHFEPVAEVTVSLDEAQLLMDLAVQHYDDLCRKAGQHGGVLWRMYGIANFEAEAQREGAVPVGALATKLRWSEVATICKVLELAPLDNPLGAQFRNLLSEMALEAARVNS